jgi:hypothetical protein
VGELPPGEKAAVVPVSVGVAVPELGSEPDRGREDVEAKSVDSDWFERRNGRLASEAAGDCARSLENAVEDSSASCCDGLIGGDGEPCGGGELMRVVGSGP